MAARYTPRSGYMSFTGRHEPDDAVLADRHGNEAPAHPDDAAGGALKPLPAGTLELSAVDNSLTPEAGDSVTAGSLALPA